jgi:hypothetical protein
MTYQKSMTLYAHESCCSSFHILKKISKLKYRSLNKLYVQYG